MPHSVLVTGAFGGVGRRTVEHVLAAGHRVVAVDLRNPATEPVAARFGSAIEVVWGDIREPEVWTHALRSIDTVVHIAAIIPPAVDRHPELAIAVNQTATFDLVKAMESSASAKRLIFASSMGVAGSEQHHRVPPLKVDEEPRATDLYGRTKIECERRIRASTLRWTILRLGVVVPGMPTKTDARNMDAMWDASPSGRVECIYDDDAGLAFANAVDCEEAIGRVLYIGGGESCRALVKDFYDLMLGTMGLGPLRAEALRRGPPHFHGDWLDTGESQRLLKFQRHSLQEILATRRANIGALRPVLKIFSPWITAYIERRSPHIKGQEGRRIAG